MYSFIKDIHGKEWVNRCKLISPRITTLFNLKIKTKNIEKNYQNFTYANKKNTMIDHFYLNWSFTSVASGGSYRENNYCTRQDNELGKKGDFPCISWWSLSHKTPVTLNTYLLWSLFSRQQHSLWTVTFPYMYD